MSDSRIFQIELKCELTDPDGTPRTGTITMTVEADTGKMTYSALTYDEVPVDNSTHEPDCSCDHCVYLDQRGKLHYRDGKMVP